MSLAESRFCINVRLVRHVRSDAIRELFATKHKHSLQDGECESGS